MTATRFESDFNVQIGLVSSLPAWQRVILALGYYLGFMTGYVLSNGKLGMTDRTVTKILILALSPVMWIDYQIIRIRCATAKFLTSQAQLLAV